MIERKKIEALLDELLDAYDAQNHNRNDDVFINERSNIAQAMHQMATSAQRAGGAATKGVSSPEKARTSAENGRKGGRPAGNIYLAVSRSTEQRAEFATIAKAQEWAALTPGAYEVDFYRLPYKPGDARIGYHNKDDEGNQQFRILNP